MPDEQTIPGPAGELEVRFDVSDSAPADARIAVLCHPHPQYGGSMNDAVLDTAVAVLLGRGWHCVRFNFRGVGASTGRFSGSGGEGEDLLAVLRWVRDTHPGARILLGGYSFGASVASQLASASDAARILLIAPPIGRMPVELPDEKDALDVIIGDRDAFVDSAALADWPADRVHLIRGADHFFSGRFEELQSAIESTLDAA